MQLIFQYIRFLYNIFNGKVDTNEIYYFVAGSYNSGPGHILDAITLGKKYGGDSEHWESVKEFLLLKSHKEYYSDPDVKCGYSQTGNLLHKSTVVEHGLMALEAESLLKEFFRKLRGK